MAQMESQAKLLAQRIELVQETVAADVAKVHEVASAKENAVDIDKLDQNMVSTNSRLECFCMIFDEFRT